MLEESCKTRITGVAIGKKKIQHEKKKQINKTSQKNYDTILTL